MRRSLLALSLVAALAGPLRADTVDYQWSATFSHFDATGPGPISLSATSSADGFRIDYGTGSALFKVAPPVTVDSSAGSLSVGTATVTGETPVFSFTAHFALSLTATEAGHTPATVSLNGTLSGGPGGFSFDGAGGAGFSGGAWVPNVSLLANGAPTNVPGFVNLQLASVPVVPVLQSVPEPSSLLLAGLGLLMGGRAAVRRLRRR